MGIGSARGWRDGALRVGGFLGVSLAILAAGLLAERRWGAMERTARALLAESRARDGTRPVLQGAAIPGKAWDGTSRALRQVPRESWVVQRLAHAVFRRPLLGEDPESFRLELRQIVGEHDVGR